MVHKFKYTDSGFRTIDGEVIGLVCLNAGFNTRSEYLHFAWIQRLRREHSERALRHSNTSVIYLKIN